MESAEFSHSRLSYLGAMFGVAFVLLFFGGFLIVGVFMIASTLAEKRAPPKEGWIGIGSGLLVFAWMCWWAIQHVRYRHAYKSKYVLESQGITVESGGSRKLIRWETIDSAEYISLFSFARLTSGGLERPMILFLPADRDTPQGEIGRSEFARRLIEVQTGSRFRKRWFP